MALSLNVAWAACLPGSVFAGDRSSISYDNVDISYQHLFYDEKGQDDGKGLLLGGEVSPIENIFFTAEYNFSESAVGRYDIEGHALVYGVGGYFPVNSAMHLVGIVEGVYERVKIDTLGTESENGYQLVAEVRNELDGGIEANLGAKYRDLGHGADAWLFGAKGVFPLQNKIALISAVGISDDSDVELTGGVRFGF